MKVNLKDIAEGFSMISNNTIVYYDRDKNTVDYIFTDFLDIDEQLEEEIPDNAIYLPSQYEIDDYQIMEDFIYLLPDGERKELLKDAINGRGAFRNFKNLVQRFELQENWYAFQNEAYRKMARRWCVNNDLEYVE